MHNTSVYTYSSMKNLRKEFFCSVITSKQRFTFTPKPEFAARRYFTVPTAKQLETIGRGSLESDRFRTNCPQIPKSDRSVIKIKSRQSCDCRRFWTNHIVLWNTKITWKYVMFINIVGNMLCKYYIIRLLYCKAITSYTVNITGLSQKLH